MKLPSIDLVSRNAKKALRRFPIPFFFAVLATIITVILIEVKEAPANGLLERLLHVSLLGAPLFLSIALRFEKFPPRKPIFLLGYLGAAFVLGAYFIYLPRDYSAAPERYLIQFTFLMHASVLLLMILPFARTEDSDGWWRYSIDLFNKFLTAFFFTLVLYLGIILVYASLEHLFGLHIHNELYFDTWIVLCGILNTWIFLGSLPDNLWIYSEEKAYHKLFRIFAQYILLPLVLVYLLIVYGYVVKICLIHQWPQEWVGMLILGFFISGKIALLLLHPLRGSDTYPWVQKVWKLFFWLMLPLVFVYPVAVSEKFTETGLTIWRYFEYTVAVWLLLIVAYFNISKKKDIKIIPWSMIIVLLAISFGPWGAFELTKTDQVGRLKQLLEKNNILVNRKVNVLYKEIPQGDVDQIMSLLSTIRTTYGFSAIKELYIDNNAQLAGDCDDDLQKHQVLNALFGVHYDKQVNRNFYFDTDWQEYLPVSGFAHMTQISIYNQRRDEITSPYWNVSKVGMVIQFEGKAGQVYAGEKLVFDCSSVIQRLPAQTKTRVPVSQLCVDAQSAHVKGRLFFISGSIELLDGRREMNTCRFGILYTDK